MIFSRILCLLGLATCATVSAQGQTLTTLYTFPEGAFAENPSSLLVENGKIYGTELASPANYIFELDIHADRERTLYQFQYHGGLMSPLLALSGYFYGTLSDGGYGYIYRLDPTTGDITTLYSFKGGNDGEYPSGGLTYANGVLYGTTDGGGPGDAGTVFSFNLNTGVEAVLAGFNNGAFGGHPDMGVIYQHGMLYGANVSGGDTRCSCGTIFSVNTATRKKRLLHAFSDKDGSQPLTTLVYLGGVLYGTTQIGGAYGNGTLFSVHSVTGAEAVLHDFGKTTDGSFPEGKLIYYAGELYGTTFNGGISGYGIVFKLDPKSGAETIIYNFTGQSDGGGPQGGVTEKGGLFFGTTSYRGGPNAMGTIFEIKP